MDDIEPNNSVALAQDVFTPFTINGAANSVDDLNDYYSFVSSGGIFDIRLSDYGTSDMDLYLIDSDGVLVTISISCSRWFR